jgi:hypothetical protein
VAADIVFDANSVGQVVTYVAPGFVARLGYKARYPGPDRPAGETLIISVVASLPLVALVSAILPGAQRPTQFGYVALLLALALAIGYGTAVLRGRQWVKEKLTKLDFRLQPEGSIYSQTLELMSDEGAVVVELKDGRRIWGCPRAGPAYKDDGINELYLTYPKAETGEDAWVSAGAGLIVPLAEVSTIALSEDPTGAPPDVSSE